MSVSRCCVVDSRSGFGPEAMFFSSWIFTGIHIIQSEDAHFIPDPEMVALQLECEN